MNRSKEQIYYEDIVPLMSKIIDICKKRARHRDQG